MYKIILEIASNGVIKTITDDNSNGAGEVLETKVVHNLNDDAATDYEETGQFMYELCEDLGIDIGSKNSRRRLSFSTEYGEGYVLTEEELKAEIKLLSYNLKWLRDDLKSRKK